VERGLGYLQVHCALCCWDISKDVSGAHIWQQVSKGQDEDTQNAQRSKVEEEVAFRLGEIEPSYVHDDEDGESRTSSVQ
jgi:hypothetical protein